MTESQRTNLQNRSFYKWLTLLAEELTAAGYDQEVLLRKLKVKAPVTKDSLKHDIAHPIIAAMFDKGSTRDLTTTEIQELYQVMDANISEVTGCTVPWPVEKEPVESFEGYREARG